jgi:hypothetical protein
MTSDEVRAAGRLAGRVFGGVVSQVEQVHEAVATRADGGTNTSPFAWRVGDSSAACTTSTFFGTVTSGQRC